MNFNDHFHLEGKHAFLGASNYHWLNYTPERLVAVYENAKKKEEGTALHDFASMAIKRRIKLAQHKKALNMFVNDAIGYGMESEQVLYYSDNCFGTADAISFKDDLLLIHDLKTGITKPSFKQLTIYAAMFCLEYDIDPNKITVIQRIYQGNGFMEESPYAEDVMAAMDKIIEFDLILENIKATIG